MRLRIGILLALIVALAAAPSALAAKPAAKPSYLFAMTSTGGALKHDTSGWWLELTGTSPLVTRFTDRPNRLASTLSPAQLAAQWRTYGFPSDPPNAALVLDGRPADADAFVIELRRPSVSGSTMRFRAKPVRDTSSALSRYAKRADRLRETRFASASLFIDDGAGTVYQHVQLTISGVQPGQRVLLGVQGSPSAPVSFSIGPSEGWESGFVLNSQWQAIPVTNLSLSGSTLAIDTLSAGGGGSTPIMVEVYLVASEGVQSFTLVNQSDPGITVTASSVGYDDAQTVNQSPTLFPWYS